MTIIGYLWGVFFSWMPPVLQICFFAFVAIAMIVLIIRIIGLVLSAVPFL